MTFEKELRQFIIDWNRLYPIDYVWRKKYNVAFNSPEHRSMSFIDMLIDFEEQEMIEKSIKKANNEEMDVNDVEMSVEEIDNEYDNLDLSKFNG